MTSKPKPEPIPAAASVVDAQVRGIHASRSDPEIIDALKRGERWAKAALFDRYTADVQRVLAWILGIDSELPDLLHDVFLRAFEGAADLSDPGRLRAWLVSIAIYTARGRIRRRARRSSLLSWFGRDPSRPLPQAGLSTPAERELVSSTRAILEQLTPDERILLTLRYMAGFGLDELADASGVSLATVKRRLHAATTRPAAVAAFRLGTLAFDHDHSYAVPANLACRPARCARKEPGWRLMPMYKSLAPVLVVLAIPCGARAQPPPRGPHIEVTAEPGTEREHALLLEHLAALGFEVVNNAAPGVATQGARPRARVGLRRGGNAIDVSILDARSGAPVKQETLQASGPGEQDRRDAVARSVEALRASLIPVEQRPSSTPIRAPAAPLPSRESAAAGTVLSIGAGAQLIASTGLTCNQDNDVVMCQEGPIAFGGVHLAPSLRLGRYVSAGLMGTMDWGAQSTTGNSSAYEASHRMVRGSAQGRLYPVRDAGLWLGLEAGVAAVSRTTTTTSPGKKSESGHTETGLLVGGGLGYEVSFSPAVAAGIEMRALYLKLDEHATSGVGWSYGERVWFSGGVSLIARIPL